MNQIKVAKYNKVNEFLLKVYEVNSQLNLVFILIERGNMIKVLVDLLVLLLLFVFSS